MDFRFLIFSTFLYVKLGDAGECSIKNCKHCTSTDECSVCKLGWFGNTCEFQCRGTNRKCSICSDSYLRKDSKLYNNNYCSGCERNEYVSNDKCGACPPNCETCKGLDNCTECKAGYFGKSCQCGSNCVKLGKTSEWCSINGTCEKGCLKGKMGSTCNLDCERNDVCIECDQFSKRCLKCTNRLYGTNYCDKKCGHCSPDDKGDIACDIESGECSNGCTHGFFGINCDKKCNPECHDPITNLNNCDNGTGECIYGCIPGRYGDKCDVNCSVNCSNNTCNQSTGQCNNGCVLGWYGLNCSQACSNSCLNRSCNVASGYCDIGCEAGWYGESCNDLCNKDCANKLCERQCDYEGYVGDVDIGDKNSSQNCFGKCKNNTCDIQSWCLLRCEFGHEGPYCNKTMQADFGAMVILVSFGIAGALIVLVLFIVVCFAIRYALCPRSISHKHENVSNKENIEPVYDVIDLNIDEMAKCKDDNVHFDTIADSVFDIASCSSKDECYGKLTNTTDRHNEYTDLTYLKLNHSRTYVPRLCPRTELLDASKNVTQDDLQTVYLQDILNEQSSNEVVIDEQLDCQEVNPDGIDLETNLTKADGSFSTRSQMSDRTDQDEITRLGTFKPSEMETDDCNYLHPIC